MTEKEIIGKMNDFWAQSGKSKAEMSRELGVDAGTLGNILNGNRGVSVGLLSKFLETYPSVSAEWLLRGIGDMRTLPDGLDSPEDVEIARLESTVETLLDRITGYKNRIKELEATLHEQKRNVG